jgi:hypothetical protein
MVKCNCYTCRTGRRWDWAIAKVKDKRLRQVLDNIWLSYRDYECEAGTELEMENRRLEDTIHDLQYKLTQCHNKNTELKGDIARRINASKD